MHFGFQTTPLVMGAAVGTVALGARYLIRAWQAFRVAPRVQRFYPGGFEPVMTRREAALILGVRWMFITMICSDYAWVSVVVLTRIIPRFIHSYDYPFLSSPCDCTTVFQILIPISWQHWRTKQYGMHSALLITAISSLTLILNMHIP